MAAQVFEHQHRVTYAECTVGNHVYYANHLAIMEEARGEFFRALGKTLLGLQDEDTIFPVLECTIKYHRPARYDDVLTVLISIAELKGVRVTFAYAVTNQDGERIIEAETRHACTTVGEKPRRLPDGLADRLKAFVPEQIMPV
ncbi:MAG TPA: thioesterase family protein [Verrucomicrobiae bacterium]